MKAPANIIFDFLKKTNKSFTKKELQTKLNLSQSEVRTGTRNLVLRNLIVPNANERRAMTFKYDKRLKDMKL